MAPRRQDSSAEALAATVMSLRSTHAWVYWAFLSESCGSHVQRTGLLPEQGKVMISLSKFETNMTFTRGNSVNLVPNTGSGRATRFLGGGVRPK